ncbi:MAG TPA: glycerophosphodiester phosphodiesterase family protein [Bacillota bacterium]|nr:glycerophosphodiester phosphodiesterase family protein [Bacillota bacterium]HPE39065.1 glycerophosphodiester phosphodiesterase family protein [Bacillota bacterium]
MNTIRVMNAKSKMIAHRGLSGIEKENTAAAFIAACNRSYYGVETDVHVTSDGYYVIYHDDSTNGALPHDISIEKCTLSEIKELQLMNTFGIRSDLRIPELYEYIQILRTYEKQAILELKNQMTKESIVGIIEVIAKENYLEHTTFISFSWENLVTIRSILPEASIQYLCKDISPDIVPKLQQYHFDIDIKHKALTRRKVLSLHLKGIKINAWTVDDKRSAHKLISYGVDYITTNILE